MKTSYINVNDYYKIGECRNEKGLFELWENKEWGDEIAALVTLDKVIVGSTHDDLYTFIDENM